MSHQEMPSQSPLLPPPPPGPLTPIPIVLTLVGLEKGQATSSRPGSVPTGPFHCPALMVGLKSEIFRSPHVA